MINCDTGFGLKLQCFSFPAMHLPLVKLDGLNYFFFLFNCLFHCKVSKHRTLNKTSRTAAVLSGAGGLLLAGRWRKC